MRARTATRVAVLASMMALTAAAHTAPPAQAASARLPTPNATPALPAVACASPSAPIDEAGYVTVGGIAQWVTIHGAHCGNPIILFVHGGPGNALSPFSRAIYGSWENDFTLVHWDQRGAGMTFLRNPATEDTPLTIEQMAADGVDVASYITTRLHQPQVILLGGSWGTALGVTMAHLKPALFHAYVGVGQIVSYRENVVASYTQTLALAREAGDKPTIAKLEALGTPPWTDPHNSGILRRVTRDYEAKTALPAPKAWWQPEAKYATPQYEAAAEAADDYSYLQFVGMKGKGIYSRVDLPALGLKFEMPVYIFAGKADLVTVPDAARRYYDSIVAPFKMFIEIPNAGHDPNPALVDAEFGLLKSRISR